jgi:hypothetical protein
MAHPAPPAPAPLVGRRQRQGVRRARRRPRRLRALCGNSRTLAVAYAAELLGVLDEAKLLDWSQLLGAEAAGRVMVVMGAVMILLRLVTRTAVSFKAEA